MVENEAYPYVTRVQARRALYRQIDHTTTEFTMAKAFVGILICAFEWSDNR